MTNNNGLQYWRQKSDKFKYVVYYWKYQGDKQTCKRKARLKSLEKDGLEA